jgi:hypothetical protein
LRYAPRGVAPSDYTEEERFCLRERAERKRMNRLNKKRVRQYASYWDESAGRQSRAQQTIRKRAMRFQRRITNRLSERSDSIATMLDEANAARCRDRVWFFITGNWFPVQLKSGKSFISSNIPQ